jgi:hypothetical protein
MGAQYKSDDRQGTTRDGTRDACRKITFNAAMPPEGGIP